jgi:hypothetical protein
MEAKILCPLMNCECVKDGAVINGELVKCRFWIQVMGTNPQSGETINSWDCTFAWMPVLLIENSSVNRQTGAAIESLRNENVTLGQHMLGAMMGVAAAQLENKPT